MDNNKVIQIGNLTDTTNTRSNPQRRRVYDKNEISPCVVDYSGGGNLFPLVIICDGKSNE